METLPDPVRPGDLITADFFNGLIERLAALEERVDVLEGDAGGDAVAITQLIPSGTANDPIRVGQTLQILGQNFGFSLGAHRVRFDQLQVTAFLPGTDDTRLIVSVPTALAVPPGGRSVTLTVSNGVTTDARVIAVHPIQITLSGDVDVLWNDTLDLNPDPNPIPSPASGTQIVRFAYRLRSRASTTAAFTVTPTVSETVWEPGLQILNANGAPIADRRIELAPNEVVPFSVQAALTPLGSPVDGFDLNVVAQAGDVVGSDQRSFTFEEEVEPSDDQIVLAVTDALVLDPSGNVNPSFGSYNPGTQTITVFEGARLFLTYDAELHQAAIYDVSVETDTPGWAVELLSPSVYDETGAVIPVDEAPRFSVQPQGGASQTGSVTFRMQRRGQASSQTRTYTLQLGVFF